MKKADSFSILASFATLKTLSDGKRYNSAYQLLSEFMNYIIYTENLFSFSSVEMKGWLKDVFGFDIPEAVVKTAAKSLPYLSKANGVYTLNRADFIPDKRLEETKTEESNKNSIVFSALKDFIKEKEPEKSINQEQLTKDLVDFLVDGDSKSSGQYFNLISEFILKKESDALVQECLRKIREGSILYIGLTYNMNETGSFKKNLTLYLDTEILFSLVGYNGEIYKTLAQDFYSQVKSANSNGEKIKLTYFPEVEKEIDDYFKTAVCIVEGKIQVMNKAAMLAIIKGCQTSADVEVKKADFYHVLRYTFGIHSDEKKNYYADEDNPFNLESKEHTDTRDWEGWKFISHINKLRKAQVYFDNIESEYLFVTNTNNTLKISKTYTNQLKAEKGIEYICDYAINLDRITNIIWYKLGNGFAKKEYPSNVSAIINARIVLASCIVYNVEQVFSNAKKQFQNGELTHDQLAARIVTLRKKPILPEEIEGDLIEDSMNFSPEYLSRFEEEVRSNKVLLEEKNQIIQDLTEQAELKLQQKDDIIAEQNQTIETQKEANLAMEAELRVYHQRDEKIKQRKILAKNIMRFAWALIWKMLVIAAITVIAVLIEKKINSNILLYIIAAIDLGGLVLVGWSAFKKDFKKCFRSEK